MSTFDQQAIRQGGRCQWCQRLIPAALWTKDHLHPRKHGQRAANGGDYVMACERCNRARSALTIGSYRFGRWLRRVMNCDVRRFERRDHWHPFIHNPT
jgi:5-methylcytosine-specific restriction endonuclease McrA